jgi:hypothetical protein
MENEKSWLQRLKDESWEAELLISTVATFGAFQLFKLIDWGTALAIDILPPSQYFLGYIIVFGGLLAISVLTSMFIIHFLLRAYWVGLVGLNSVFPDYSLEDSAYSKIYTEKILAILPKLKKTIQDVDELCSVIYSAAFFMLFIYVYFSLMLGFIVLLYNLLSPHIPDWILSIPIYIFAVGYAVLIMLTIIGNLKKYKSNYKVQTLYFKASKLGNVVMLGPFYKYMMQISMTFGSNYKKKKSLIGLVVAFVMLGTTFTIFHFVQSSIPYLIIHDTYFDNTRTYPGFYNSSSNNQEFLIAPQIDSDVIQSKFTRLFIPIYKYERSMSKEVCGEVDGSKSRQEKREWYLDCYSQYHQIYLNDQQINPDFIKYEMPTTGQFGIMTYLNLEEQKNWQNTIRVVKTIGDTLEWEIPFQYVPKE